MTRFFYPRLAITNIRNNKDIYVPYLLVGSLVAMLFYCLRSVQYMLVESGAAGAGVMGVILMLSTWICGIFSMIILLYINSFIMKRRKREFGLYAILGMEKRHIGRVMAWEIVLTGAACIACGIVGGALLSQLMFLVLLKLTHLPVMMTFQVPLGAVSVTAVVYGVAFLALLVYDLISIARLDPIALLHSDKLGEREPKTKWPIAILGLLTLGGGYYLALGVRVASDAIAVFFPAVLLVIIGTYCLFLCGSIAILKLLRRNKGYYYKPKNFISVSGMMYRMKQNAAGLATICILSTCVLVTLSSTVSLFLGEEDSLISRYPRQVVTDCIVENQDSGLILEQANRTYAEESGVQIANTVGYYAFSYPGVINGAKLMNEPFYMQETGLVHALVLDDYNRLTGAQWTLAPGEVLLCDETKKAHGAALELDSGSYAVRGQIEVPDFLPSFTAYPKIVVVLPSYAELERLQNAINAINVVESQDGSLSGQRNIMYEYSYDVDLGDADEAQYYDGMRAGLLRTVDRLSDVSSRDLIRNEFFQLYGTLLFVGMVCVVLFLIATALIIYYKQITEGFDDHVRFGIMQSVGMSDREVRATINKQVLMVFFLPLGMAVLHIVVAFPVLCRLLQSFNMYNTALFLKCTIGAALVFGVLYLLVYLRTSQIYYKIVQGKKRSV